MRLKGSSSGLARYVVPNRKSPGDDLTGGCSQRHQVGLGRVRPEIVSSEGLSVDGHVDLRLSGGELNGRGGQSRGSKTQDRKEQNESHESSVLYGRPSIDLKLRVSHFR